MLNPNSLAWEKMNQLIPAIVQDAFDGRVLMQAFMNQDALEVTLATGKVTFWSRSRQQLWTKGETSGNTLELLDITSDCDNDCLLVMATPSGPVCHLGLASCFDRDQPFGSGLAFLAQLDRVIEKRHSERPAESYTTRLFEDGVKRIAQKVGEEGVETALAAVSGDDEELLNEASDLVYHLLVLLRGRELSLERLVDVLKSRHS